MGKGTRGGDTVTLAHAVTLWEFGSQEEFGCPWRGGCSGGARCPRCSPRLWHWGGGEIWGAWGGSHMFRGNITALVR